MNRLRESEARTILQEELDRVGWHASSVFTVEDGERPESADIAWWHANTPDNESSTTLRNLAYLRSYLRISGPIELLAGGINLYRRKLWMDRSVISRLERDGFLVFRSDGQRPAFRLTDKGREWVEADGWNFIEVEVG